MALKSDWQAFRLLSSKCERPNTEIAFYVKARMSLSIFYVCRWVTLLLRVKQPTTSSKKGLTTDVEAWLMYEGMSL